MTLASRGTLGACQAVQTSSSRPCGYASSRMGASSTDAPATPGSHGRTPCTGVTRFSAMVAGIVATRGCSESPAGQCGEFGSMTSRRLESAIRWHGCEGVSRFDVEASRRRTSPFSDTRIADTRSELRMCDAAAAPSQLCVTALAGRGVRGRGADAVYGKIRYVGAETDLRRS